MAKFPQNEMQKMYVNLDGEEMTFKTLRAICDFIARSKLHLKTLNKLVHGGILLKPGYITD